MTPKSEVKLYNSTVIRPPWKAKSVFTISEVGVGVGVGVGVDLGTMINEEFENSVSEEGAKALLLQDIKKQLAIINTINRGNNFMSILYTINYFQTLKACMLLYSKEI